MSHLPKSAASAAGARELAQQLEVIGQVTGSVAHDFNNLLMVILGNLEALERRLGRDHELQHLVAAALGGAMRAAQVTERLFALAPHPSAADGGIAPEPDIVVAPLGGSGDAVLIVEDDPDVRSYTVDVARELGYEAISAGDGKGALQLLDAHPEVRLLFTDLGLPGGMNGRQLADEATRRQPSLKVLLTTGYARNIAVDNGRLGPEAEVVLKPFTYSDLASRIRRVFDGSRV